MAEEGNLGVARALEPEVDAARATLRTRIDETRESTTGAADDKYVSVTEAATDFLDFREEVRKHPVAWSLGALGLGIFVGYSLLRVVDRNDEIDEPSDDAPSEDSNPSAIQFEGSGPSAFTENHSYAAHARAVAHVDDEQIISGPEKPGLIGRFKETRAYDRLQEEIAVLGSRFMDELANAARTVVLPALFNKLKEKIGVNLARHRQSNSASTQAPMDDSIPVSQGRKSNQDQSHATLDVLGQSESGRPVYLATKGSSSKFDRLANSSPIIQGDTSPHINLNYDDRYERESKLFSRGETRGFAPEKLGGNRPETTHNSAADEDEVPHGGDYTYKPGLISDDTKD